MGKTVGNIRDAAVTKSAHAQKIHLRAIGQTVVVTDVQGCTFGNALGAANFRAMVAFDGRFQKTDCPRDVCFVAVFQAIDVVHWVDAGSGPVLTLSIGGQ